MTLVERLLVAIEEAEVDTKDAREALRQRVAYAIGIERGEDEFTMAGGAVWSSLLKKASEVVNSDVHLDPHGAVLRLCQAHREIIAMYPMSAPHLDTHGSFYGFQARDCGEHRTVGPHRAWCFDCNEWCYPNGPCRLCHGVHDVIKALAGGYGIQEEP